MAYHNWTETAPPPGGHVFPPIWTIFELSHWIKNVTLRVFTCFLYIHIEKTATPPGGHFHDDWANIVNSRVFTRKTAPSPGGHLHEDWALNVTSTVFTSFEFSRGINGTNVLTKFHEDRTINVASGMFTRQMLTGHDARRTKGDHKS
ncbi:hypothetical protein DPMN_062607 [Dreissena polymorpha]|uniref:Uncharacterized protein n=1 Tax=Dreissena polymorpha TaxID=45954 RepID=A0A9D4HKB7_DREPO|nr:hypothetical protein DPMN_062607 [Dreissena polymorpha]